MQNQTSVAIILPLLSRIAGAWTSEAFAKKEMNKVAFQLDFTSGVTDGTTFSLQCWGSLDGVSWRAVGSPTTGTTSSTVKGCIMDIVTAAPLVRCVVTTGVNTASFSIMAVGGM